MEVLEEIASIPLVLVIWVSMLVFKGVGKRKALHLQNLHIPSI